MKLKLIALALTLAALSGCATVSAWFGSPTGAVVIQAAVDVAVATAEQKGIAAAQINSIAKQALAADAGASTTVAAIGELIETQIAKLNLPAGDQAAAAILITALEAAITAKLAGNASVAQTQAAVATVLNDVIGATT